MSRVYVHRGGQERVGLPQLLMAPRAVLPLTVSAPGSARGEGTGRHETTTTMILHVSSPKT